MASDASCSYKSDDRDTRNIKETSPFGVRHSRSSWNCSRRLYENYVGVSPSLSTCDNFFRKKIKKKNETFRKRKEELRTKKVKIEIHSPAVGC